MSNFSYAQYQEAMNNQPATTTTDFAKIGYFNLPKDGDEALVRFNISKPEDLLMATLHGVRGTKPKFAYVSCLVPFGEKNVDNICPFCSGANDNSIIKASRKVIVPFLVAYKDKATGNYSDAIPVDWVRPSGFARELAGKIADYGDLREHVFKIKRIGTGQATNYSLDYIPLYDKETLIPKDFSAFANYRADKHAYWVKTKEEIETFIATGSFPDTFKATNTTVQETVQPAFGGYSAAATTSPIQEVPVVKAADTADAMTKAETTSSWVVVNDDDPFKAKTAAPAPKAEERPARNFSGFSEGNFKF